MPHFERHVVRECSRVSDTSDENGPSLVKTVYELFDRLLIEAGDCISKFCGLTGKYVMKRFLESVEGYRFGTFADDRSGYRLFAFASYEVESQIVKVVIAKPFYEAGNCGALGVTPTCDFPKRHGGNCETVVQYVRSDFLIGFRHAVVCRTDGLNDVSLGFHDRDLSIRLPENRSRSRLTCS